MEERPVNNFLRNWFGRTAIYALDNPSLYSLDVYNVSIIATYWLGISTTALVLHGLVGIKLREKQDKICVYRNSRYILCTGCIQLFKEKNKKFVCKGYIKELTI